MDKIEFYLKKHTQEKVTVELERIISVRKLYHISSFTKLEKILTK